jgi:hypothetical protein
VAEPTVQFKGTREVESLLEKLPKSTFEQTKEAFGVATKETHRLVQQKFTAGPLHVRTGEGKRSFKYQLTGTSLENLIASVYSGAVGGSILVYIPVHEFGAMGEKRIKAKRAYSKVPGGPYLNIPMPANLTAKAGVARYNAYEVFRAGGYLAKVGGAAQKWFVMSKDGVPMFKLQKYVEIKPRLGFFDIADDQTKQLIGTLEQQLPEAWRQL